MAIFTFPSKRNPIEHRVEMVGLKFIPYLVTVKLGDSIKFFNKSKYLYSIVFKKKLKIKTKYVEKGKNVIVNQIKVEE